MRHHDAPRFGRLLQAARATLAEHRAVRERFCAELQARIGLGFGSGLGLGARARARVR
jgi:hypothetical protein